jgi:hypothetical protein
MRIVPTEFEHGPYHFRQLERQGDVAIYEQQHKENPKVIRYEVVRIKMQAERVLPSGKTMPEGEAYPSSSAWGRDGFTENPFWKLLSSGGRGKKGCPDAGQFLLSLKAAYNVVD